MVRAIFAAAALALIPVSVAAKDAPEAEIAELAQQICDRMERYRELPSTPVSEALKEEILGFVGASSNAPDWEQRMAAFWNANHEAMVCTDSVIGYTSPQPILKRVVDMRVSASFFGDFFFNYDNLNVNAVEQTERGPETLLDYLYFILRDPEIEQKFDVQHIEFLIEYLEDVMNGKRASEL